MNGNPSTVTIAYDLSKNYSESRTRWAVRRPIQQRPRYDDYGLRVAT